MEATKEFRIFMRSDVFGREDFGPYKSWEECCEAMWRLAESAGAAYETDSIVRVIGFEIGGDEEECTS